MRPTWLRSTRFRCGAGVVMLLAWVTSTAVGSESLKWQERSGYRVAPLSVPATGRSGFTRLRPHATGIAFTNALAEGRSLTNHILLNGSGVALGDVDEDGLPDLYFCGLDGPNALFKNLGNWKFREVTEESGVACLPLDATGATLVDLDGDRDLDLLVSGIGCGTLCFINDGTGRFHRRADAGTESVAGSLSAALADVDGDGDLDLYVTNYRTYTHRDSFSMRLRMNRVNGKLVVTSVNGRPVTELDLVGRFTVDEAGNLIENGEVDTLFLNDGRGGFEACSFTDGRFLDEDGKPLPAPPFDWSLSAMFRDLNGDGWPDLYVCSDMASVDRLWMNLGNGRFQAARRESLRKTSWFSMGIDFGDLNRDGLDDFFVTDMVSREHRLRQVQVSNHKLVYSRPGVIDDRPQAPRNTLMVNLGDGDFAEVAFAAGLYASEWSWAPVFLDVDLDGFEDILVVTGFERDVQNIDVANRLEAARQSQKLSDAEALAMRREFPALRQANLLFRNRGDLTFEETGGSWGFGDVGISQGLALADLDGDGDLDVVVNNLNEAAGVYRNDSVTPRVAVRLRGQAPNTRGIGARIQLFGGTVPEQSQEMTAGGRYLSSDDPMRTFAAGHVTNRMRLEVRWRTGRVSRIEDVRANCLYEVSEASAPPEQPTRRSSPSPIFVDATDRLGHAHVENYFDDFARQPLLPRRMSQAGPGIAWHDFNGDGWEDLLIGTGRGGGLGLYQNDTRGGFHPLTNALTQKVSRDLTGVVIAANDDGQPLALVGFSNYEGRPGEPGSVMQLNLATGSIADAVPPSLSEPGPIALADWDGDGDLDLFVGGRTIPGRYPESASSRLFRREHGEWVVDELNTARLERIGLVNGAVFTDLDNDGYAELVLATDWGPIRVFRNERGTALREVTVELGLDRFRGWWQGVTAGDFDGDGRMDLLASNWGMNTKYATQLDRPPRLYFGDFNGAGDVDLIEAYHDRGAGKWVPWPHFGRVRMALPFVQAQFNTYHEFSAASVEEILGDRVPAAGVLEANWLASTVFLNRGDRFTAQPLPGPAQWAPAFAVCVADLDGDGREDAFLSQNFFATEPETDRGDGGRGLWLRGDGQGGFSPLMARESGVRVYGEQRGAAVGDFDADGRVDFAVTQNGNATRLFRNIGGRPGLRVSLRGAAGNPQGVGASVRIAWGDDWGPAREVLAGSGYLSQASAVQVFGTPRPPTGLMVRWPGGRMHRAAVPGGAAEIRVDLDGRVEQTR
ncbi:MAG: FG-GAP-like repeat-containing protein [Limisphaerales bacterium]